MRLRLVRDAGSRGEEMAALVIVAAGGMAAAWLRAGLPTPRCVFHAATGLPCLTCGATRSAQSLLEGNVAAAIEWNPLVFLLGAGATAFVIYAALVATLGLPRLRIVDFSRKDGRWVRAVAVAAIAANWVYLGVLFSSRG